MVAEIVTNELVNNTGYKLIKNAFNEGKLEVLYFPRENLFRIEKYPNSRVYSFVIMEMERIFPGSKIIN